MITHVYTLNTTNQLVDINDTYTSFTTMYSVTCDNIQDEFDYAIASQDMLDSKKVHFKKAIGYIEDSITRNEGKFENWYLILRANKDTPCKVMLEMTSLDVSPPASPQPQQRSQISGRSQLPIDQPTSAPRQLQRQSQQPQRRRPPPNRPVRPRPPPPPPDSDDETDDEFLTENFEHMTPEQQPLDWWWYALVVLVVILIIVFLLWWFGKLHLLPFYKYFKSGSSCKVAPVVPVAAVEPAPIVVASAPVVVAPPPPPVALPPPPPPTPTIEISEPEIFVAPPPPQPLDANFINEMRELKLNF
jgi:hypothetical protein